MLLVRGSLRRIPLNLGRTLGMLPQLLRAAHPFYRMPQAPDLSADEYAAVVAALRKLIYGDKFPFSPRLKPFKSALAKFEPPTPHKPFFDPPQPGDRPR